MEAELPVVWLVMDNDAFGTIAGLSEMHYGSTFGCTFERQGYNSKFTSDFEFGGSLSTANCRSG